MTINNNPLNHIPTGEVTHTNSKLAPTKSPATSVATVSGKAQAHAMDRPLNQNPIFSLSSSIKNSLTSTKNSVTSILRDTWNTHINSLKTPNAEGIKEGIAQAFDSALGSCKNLFISKQNTLTSIKTQIKEGFTKASQRQSSESVATSKQTPPLISATGTKVKSNALTPEKEKELKFVYELQLTRLTSLRSICNNVSRLVQATGAEKNQAREKFTTQLADTEKLEVKLKDAFETGKKTGFPITLSQLAGGINKRFIQASTVMEEMKQSALKKIENSEFSDDHKAVLKKDVNEKFELLKDYHAVETAFFKDKDPGQIGNQIKGVVSEIENILGLIM